MTALRNHFAIQDSLTRDGSEFARSAADVAFNAAHIVLIEDHLAWHRAFGERLAEAERRFGRAQEKHA